MSFVVVFISEDVVVVLKSPVLDSNVEGLFTFVVLVCTVVATTVSPFVVGSNDVDGVIGCSEVVVFGTVVSSSSLTTIFVVDPVVGVCVVADVLVDVDTALGVVRITCAGVVGTVVFKVVTEGFSVKCGLVLFAVPVNILVLLSSVTIGCVDVLTVRGKAVELLLRVLLLLVLLLLLSPPPPPSLLLLVFMEVDSEVFPSFVVSLVVFAVLVDANTTPQLQPLQFIPKSFSSISQVVPFAYF
jgi:hypothetical protein